MGNICYPIVRGRRLRATRLDGCGNPVLGPDSTVVTKGFISVALTANIEEGEEINVTNANGDVCVLDTPCPKFLNYSVEINFCDVNPALFNLMSGQPLVTNGTDTVGFRMNSEISVCDSGFALELWTGVPTEACAPGVSASYGYLLLPFIQGGVLGDFTVENAAINFTLTGARTKKGSGWGVGPYNVVNAVTTNEVKRITVTGTPTGGTFTILFYGVESDPIAYNANAAAVQAALEAMSNIEPGDVTVTGGPFPGAFVNITFGGQYEGVDVPNFTAGDNNLTGGTSPNFTLTTVTQGSSVPSPLAEPITLGDHLHLERTTLAPPEEDCDPDALGVPATGATAGTPGSYTPTNSYGPADLAALQTSGIVASPNTAWTSGQYIVLRDGSSAHWDGDSWESGAA